jgi:ABC-type uncharacterized transport system ATPase subunit
MSKQNWQWPLRSALLWALVGFFLFTCGPFAQTQNATDSGSLQNLPPELSLSDNLNLADSNLQTLLLRLAERKQQVSELQVSLVQAAQNLTDSEQASAELELHLKEAEASVAILQQELRATLFLLAGVRTQYDMLSEAFGAYVEETQQQKRQLISERDMALRQARLWKIAALTGGGLVIAGGIALVIILVR